MYVRAYVRTYVCMYVGVFYIIRRPAGVFCGYSSDTSLAQLELSLMFLFDGFLVWLPPTPLHLCISPPPPPPLYVSMYEPASKRAKANHSRIYANIPCFGLPANSPRAGGMPKTVKCINMYILYLHIYI